jgi:hypothetical protein
VFPEAIDAAVAASMGIMLAGFAAVLVLSHFAPGPDHREN